MAYQPKKRKKRSVIWTCHRETLESLVRALDHKNGIATDHRRENLRLLCPNCHSQTPTFAGRRNRKIRPARPEIHDRMKVKVSNAQVAEMCRTKSKLAVAKELGISDVAVGKRLRRHQKMNARAGVEPATPEPKTGVFPVKLTGNGGGGEI